MEDAKVMEETAETNDDTKATIPVATDQIKCEDFAANAPTAPSIEDFDVTAADHLVANKMYPNLQFLHSNLSANPSLTKDRITLQPFTSEQLRELYHNPELQMAETFEMDFINTELNNTHKDHSLYELIKKYSHSRYNLKVNMLDLHGYIKCFQDNSQKVWIIKNQFTSYEGVCADGERVRKNELYE